MEAIVILGAVGVFILLLLYNKYLHFKEYNDNRGEPTIPFWEFVVQYAKQLLNGRD